EGEVKRSRVDGTKTFCAVKFLQAETSYEDLVRFVYGDSKRWEQVWDLRARGIPLLDLFWQLGRMGFRGTWLCGAIVARAAWRLVARGFAHARKAAIALLAAAAAL